MNLSRWQIRFAWTLVALSLVLYALRWFLFSGAQLHNEMLRFLLGDIAFLFVQVPLVTLLIDNQIQRRQREEMLRKLNMVIGTFFSETGTEILGVIASADAKLAEVRSDLVPHASWAPGDYEQAKAAFSAHQPQIDVASMDLENLRDRLADQKHFILGLLGNANLLEHESFTDLLWALTHVAEELAARRDLGQLGHADAIHLGGDIKRVYVLLGRQWLDYLRHLQDQYPYLFSLAVRVNPLDPEAEPEVAA